MRPPRLRVLVVLFGLVEFALTGCGRKHDESDSHAHGQETVEDTDGGRVHRKKASSGAYFEPGTGVILPKETRQSIGIETVEVARRRLPVELRFTAQVFGENHQPTAGETEHAGCTGKASGLLAQTQAASLRAGLPVRLTQKSGEVLGGTVLSVHKSLAIGDAEVVIGITNAGARLQPAEFLSAFMTVPRDESVRTVPRSAVLRTADGTFVYALNGDAYFRTAVRIGVEAEDFVEITDGLSEGDLVVTRPVEKLWLIELRSTRGGGHSH